MRRSSSRADASPIEGEILNARPGCRAGALLLGAVVMPSILVGCAGKTLTNNADLAAVRQTTVTTQEELRALRALVEGGSGGAGESQAEILLAIEDLEARFDRLEAQLTDLLDGLGRFQQPARPGAGYASGAGPSAPAGPGAPGPEGVGAGPGGPGSGEVTAPMAGRQEDPRAAYEAGYLDVTRGHYDAAILKFEEFLRTHPASDLADNAVYWVGECHYAKRDFNRAAEAFVRLIDSYPSGDKVPAAMLKLGFAFQENGDRVAARRYLETLAERFPGTEEAAKARARLAEL